MTLLKRLLGASATTGAVAMAWSAYTRRPLSHLADPGALDDRRRPTGGGGGGGGARTHDSRAADSLLHVATRGAVLSVVTAVSRAVRAASPRPGESRRTSSISRSFAFASLKSNQTLVRPLNVGTTASASSNDFS